MTKQHINRAYESELKNIRDRIVLIGTRVEKMAKNASVALATGDILLAKETIRYDEKIDREELVIDRLCIEILASRQPVGEDLRLVVSVLKMVTYFERIGDLAAKICQTVVSLKESPGEYKTTSFEEMAALVQTMLKKTIESFVQKDTIKAQQVFNIDQQVNEIYRQITHQYIKEIIASHHDIHNLYQLLSMAKWLERMGDHCTNLAELIIFMVQGKDIRHPSAGKEESVF